MNCSRCGKLIGEGTMGTILPLCQCQWRQPQNTFYVQDQSAEIESLRAQIAALTKERDEYKTIWENEYRLRCKAQARVVELREFVQLLADYIPASAIGNMTVQQALATRDDSSALERRLAEERERKDAAYLERNTLVALLAKIYPSGIKRTAIAGWSDDWHGCVYIDFPWGQASWHYHDSQSYLFDSLPPYKGEWDGHTTDEKYAAIRSMGK